jgi:hypothetical protein
MTSRSWRDFLPAVAESLGRGRQEFGDRFEVPVRLMHMDVPEVGGEQREQWIDIETGSIPADERSDRKAMPLMPRAA